METVARKMSSHDSQITQLELFQGIATKSQHVIDIEYSNCREEVLWILGDIVNSQQNSDIAKVE